MKRTAFFLLLLTCLHACKPGKSLFGASSAHEQYAQKLKSAGLDQTSLGQQWFAAADSALFAPQTILLPYKEMGYFPAEKPRATGLKFKVRQGEKLHFQLDITPDTAFQVFVELWRVQEDGTPQLLQASDSAQARFTQEVDRDDTYILRLQPELLKSGEYTVSISVGPQLAFPVKGGRVGSVWGDDRDAGARRHEGIDIFAPKRSPALAAADGFVTSVREGGIGGKAVFMRPEGKPFSLYYAHLDEQLVTNGERVKAGDTIGLVGNTGNARTTPPHLHFGIYTSGGAVNPFPFVNPTVRRPENLSTTNKSQLQDTLLLTTLLQIGNTRYGENIIVFPLAASAKSFRVQLPNGVLAEVPVKAVRTASVSLRQASIKKDSFLQESPQAGSPRKVLVKTGTPVKVLGFFSDYAYVETAHGKGWLLSMQL